MDTKLTLKLNQSIIERAKKYASEKKVSLSSLIENYLDSITIDKKNNDLEITPFVKSISNGVKLNNLDNWKKIRKNYDSYLDEKYK